MTLLTLGLNHTTAPLAIRETVAFPAEQSPDALRALVALPQVSEGAILSTCNRTEIYAVAAADNDRDLRDWLCAQRGLDSREMAAHFYAYHGRDSVRHALRVASGLDSMILGETQILGQMKSAFRAARSANSAGPVLTRLFEHSFAVAKNIRSQTRISANPVSVAYAGVSLARRIFSDFAEQTAMFIGAGDTVELTARHLAEAGVSRMIFANRSLDRAQALASRYRGYAITIDDVQAHLAEADVLVASTAAPAHVVSLDNFRTALKQRLRKPMFVLDLAVPRDIEPAAAELEDVYLYTVDDLQGVIRDNMRSRREAAALADSMIDERIDEYLAWLESRRAVNTISQLRGAAAAERDAVLARARRQLAAGQPADAVLENLARTLTNKLVHGPTRSLRQARGAEQQQLIDSVEALFDIRPSDGE